MAEPVPQAQEPAADHGTRGFKVPSLSLGLSLHHHGQQSPSPITQHAREEDSDQALTETQPQDKDTHGSPNDAPVAVATTTTASVPPIDSISSAHVEPPEDAVDDNGVDASTTPSSTPSGESPTRPMEQQTHPPLQYNEPQWSGAPDEAFSLTVIKNGTVVREIPIRDKPYVLFGRLPICHVPLEHPSISRYHAILQHRPVSSESDTKTASSVDNITLFSTNPKEAGFYVYDLGSTHGTYLNKSKIQPRCYYRVRVGQMLRFGGSSRIFVLEHGGLGEGGQEEVEEEAEKERMAIERQKAEWEERQVRAKEEKERERQREEEAGATWGMVLDDVPPHDEESGEETDVDPKREAYYKDDPKKALKKFFDREGLELEYETEEDGPLHARIYTIRVRLPIEMAGGESVCAEASVTGRKKEAVKLCALNACRILDAQDILRNPMHAARKRRVKKWEEMDYYDSDEDTFLDRTGEIEQKRKKRMKRAGKLQESAESFVSLQSQLMEIQQEIHTLQDTLTKAKEAEKDQASSDSLDVYMENVGSQLDKGRKAEIKHRLHELRKDEERIAKLVNIARPADLPSLSQTHTPEQANKGLKHPTSSEAAQKPQPQKPKAKPQSPGNAQTTSLITSADTASTMVSSTANSRVAVEADTARNDDAQPHSSTFPQAQTSPSKKTPRSPISPKPHAKRARLVGPTLPPQIRKQLKSQEKAMEEKGKAEREDPDFASWLPPDDQTGDGRTHLNEKFGY